MLGTTAMAMQIRCVAGSRAWYSCTRTVTLLVRCRSQGS